MTPAQYRSRLVGSIGAKGTSAFGWTVTRLDPVSVRIDDEGGVVVRAAYRAQTGGTIVVPACGYRCRVKCIDGGGIRCCKAEVQTRLVVGWNRVLGPENPKRDTVASIPVTHQRFRSPQTLVSERLQHGVVKALASVDVPYADRDVSDHGPLPKSAAQANVLPRKIRYSVSVSRSVVPRGAEIQTKASQDPA